MMDSFRDLYVISDLHMGGRRDHAGNFQIFDREERLSAFINHIGDVHPRSDLGLVINGDIFDSLAEDMVDGYAALSEREAAAMMAHLFEDPTFSQVWQALRTFLGKKKRHLVLLIGNHDIELALPVVQDAIRHYLCQGQEESAARLKFAAHGQGYGCQVGTSRVFCSHGNEVDPWNSVDYDQLAQLANAMNAGRQIDRSQWTPNAGTRLVVDIMNSIKRRFPFVDVLKPEVAAVSGVLMALDRRAFQGVDLGSIFPIVRDKIKGSLKTRRLLGPGQDDIGEAPVQAVAAEAADQLLGAHLKEAVRRAGHRQDAASEDDLLLQAESEIASGLPFDTRLSDQQAGETLGVGDMISGWIGLVSREEALRQALRDWLKDDNTFKVDEEDDLFKAMESRVASGLDFVVTGHTHKPRALSRPGGGYYFNSGTWIRTLLLTRQVLEDKQSFEDELWPKLLNGTLDDLDQAQIPGPGGEKVPLLFDRTTAVRIAAEGSDTVGELLRVEDGSEAGQVNIRREPETESLKVKRS